MNIWPAVDFALAVIDRVAIWREKRRARRAEKAAARGTPFAAVAEQQRQIKAAARAFPVKPSGRYDGGDDG